MAITRVLKLLFGAIPSAAAHPLSANGLAGRISAPATRAR
jgi:hypothetical protein